MKFRWLKFLIAALVVTAGVMVCTQSLDNDSWYVLAEGKEIVENGIYYEDRLSMHEGLEVTVQNYGFAVIFYLVYQAFGPVGIYIGMLLLNLLLCYLLYKICMLLSNKNENLSLIIIVLTDLLLGRWFVVTRAQMVSFCVIMLVIYILELYIKTNKNKYLWYVPLLSLFEINLHASIWPMILIILIVYIIDSLKLKKMHLQGYKTRPLLAILLVSVFVGFLNPYGLKMMTLMVASYAVPEAQSSIMELGAFRPFGGSFNILLYLSFVLTIIFYIFGKKQNIRVRWLIMLFGFLALGLNTIKGLGYLILVLLFPLAGIYRDVRIENYIPKRFCWATIDWIGILGICVIVAVGIVCVPEVLNGPNEELVATMDALDEFTKEVDRNNLKVYTGYDEGGYAEYRGYRTYIDPRMEVFIKANNGKENIFQEWYDLRHGDIERDIFLQKYDFDYLVVGEDDKLYNLDGNYELVFEKDNGDDNKGMRLYKKVNV